MMDGHYDGCRFRDGFWHVHVHSQTRRSIFESVDFCDTLAVTDGCKRS